ncbi:hypothetical protein BDZ97DRAFT_1862737 [Flammula alnicola]|nr:hypothetical protein BDZ97DRAFT_1862737 [Flammula alnicola]
MPPYLDSLYYHILSSVDISKVSNILSLLLLFQLERKASVLMGSTLFGSRNEEADDTLSQLESIISIPSNDYSQLRIIHTTVSDFLLDLNLCIDALNSLNSPSRTSTRYRYRDLNMHDLRLIFMKNYSKLRPEYIGPRFLLFDFVQHLHWCVEASITEGPQFNGQVPDFLTWVMQMHYMHRSISPHQLDSIDEWFHIQLSLYPQEVYTTHLLAVISLVDISMPFLQIFDVLTAHVDTQEVSLFKRIDNIRLSLLQLSENVHTSYRSLISGFLLDHLRAKKYFIGMDRQIALAKHILVFLSELPGGEILPDDLPLAKVTLNLIPLILPHSPKVWELVECMERHLLPHMKLNMSICSEIKLAARAIDIYQQEYHATHSTFEP